MPRYTEWTQRLPHVIEEIRALPCPTVDRSTIQALFHVSPRQALRILDRLGAYQAGKCLLLERQDLLDKLESLKQDENIQFDARRRERVITHLNRVRRDHNARRVNIPVPIDGTQPAVHNLSAGILLTQGDLRIRFTGAQELLSKLFELAQAISNDYETFEELLRGTDV